MWKYIRMWKYLGFTKTLQKLNTLNLHETKESRILHNTLTYQLPNHQVTTPTNFSTLRNMQTRSTTSTSYKEFPDIKRGVLVYETSDGVQKHFVFNDINKAHIVLVQNKKLKSNYNCPFIDI